MVAINTFFVYGNDVFARGSAHFFDSELTLFHFCDIASVGVIYIILILKVTVKTHIFRLKF